MSATNRAPEPSLLQRLKQVFTRTKPSVNSTDLPDVPSSTVPDPSVENLVPAHNIERVDPASSLLRKEQEAHRDVATSAVDGDVLAADVILPGAGKTIDQVGVRRSGIKNVTTRQMSQISAIVQTHLTNIQTWGDQRNNAIRKAEKLSISLEGQRGKLEDHQKVGSRKLTRRVVRLVILLLLAGEFAITYIAASDMGLRGWETYLFAFVMAGTYGSMSELHIRSGQAISSALGWLYALLGVAGSVSVLALAQVRTEHIINSTSAVSYAPTASSAGFWEQLTSGAPVTFAGQVAFTLLVPLVVMALSHQYRDPEADRFEQDSKELALLEDRIHSLNHHIHVTTGALLALKTETQMVLLRAIEDLRAEVPLARIELAEYYGSIARTIASPEATVAGAIQYQSTKHKLDGNALDEADQAGDTEFFQGIEESLQPFAKIVTAIEASQASQITTIETLIAPGFAPLQIEAKDTGNREDGDGVGDDGSAGPSRSGSRGSRADSSSSEYGDRGRSVA